AWRDLQFGLEVEHTGHGRGIGFDYQIEEVGNLAIGHVGVHVDFVAFALYVDDSAFAGELGGAERGIDLLEIGVAAGSVDNCLEASGERHGMICGVEREVWYVGFSAHSDAIELAVEEAGRLEDSA